MDLTTVCFLGAKPKSMRTVIIVLSLFPCHSTLFVPIRVCKTYVPVRLASFLRANIEMTGNSHCTWEAVDSSVSGRIMEKYFSANMTLNQTCELFLIEGVPSAAMLYHKNNQFGMPVVDSFHLNKGLLLLFGAASTMRRTLYRRYKHITTEHARSKCEFLNCP